MFDGKICLANRYEYLENDDSLLGEGTFGRVYAGLDMQTDSGVAVKRIPLDKVKQSEMDVLRQLNSPYVITYIDVVSQADFTYILMELCDSDLALHIEQFGSLNSDALETVVDNMAKGYHVLYTHNIIHRDIKPHNILLRYNDQERIVSAKLTDFGACKNYAAFNLAGTPHYMAPEVGANILDHSMYDAQVDMWSIGVVIFECATGEVPFDESGLCRLFLYAANRNYATYTPPDLTPDTPPRFSDLCTALLQLDYSRRMAPDELFEWAQQHDRPKDEWSEKLRRNGFLKSRNTTPIRVKRRLRTGSESGNPEQSVKVLMKKRRSIPLSPTSASSKPPPLPPPLKQLENISSNSGSEEDDCLFLEEPRLSTSSSFSHTSRSSSVSSFLSACVYHTAMAIMGPPAAPHCL